MFIALGINVGGKNVQAEGVNGDYNKVTAKNNEDSSLDDKKIVILNKCMIMEVKEILHGFQENQDTII